MKVIVVDDEPAMHTILRRMLSKLPDVHVAGMFTETASAYSFLEQNDDIGLALVDISMSGESGLTFASKLEASATPVQVVFVTSHKEFALDAYELSVIDYLVKPVSQERLQRTVNRVLANRRIIHTPSVLAESDNGKLIVTALGDVSAASEAGRVKWISRKCAELFAYLLLHRNKRIPRSRLIAEIFGGMHRTNAESYLNTTVYQLRKSLEAAGIREAVRSENDGYALQVNNARIDYAEFEQRIERLQVIDASNVGDALYAERLYTGDLFGDKAYVWAIHQTEHYARLYDSFVKRLAAALMSLGDPDAASKLLLKLKDRNPLDETVVRQLMTIREMVRDKKGLTTLYTDYVRLLSRELGVRPTAELVHFYDSLLSRFNGKK